MLITDEEKLKELEARVAKLEAQRDRMLAVLEKYVGMLVPGKEPKG